MSIYTNSDEHKRLIAIFTRCEGNPHRIFYEMTESSSFEDKNYFVCLEKLTQKAATGAMIFACHMIAGDYSETTQGVGEELVGVKP